MKNCFKFIAVILVISVLFGILSVGCFAEPNKPFTVKDPAASQSTQTVENTDNTEVPENNGTSETAENSANTETAESTENSTEENQSSPVTTLETKNLDTFESEEELLDFIKEHYINNIIYYGYATDDMEILEEATAEVATETAPTATASSYNGGVNTDGAKGEDRDVSSTNLVDENVDEGDYVKTDGDYIYIIRDNELIIVSAKGKDTEVLSYYKLFAQGEGSVAEMYIKGDRAIVIANVTYYEKPDFISDTSFGKPVEDVEDGEITDSYYYGY
ncbi:MAG: beta-propeller domain-containing protein, partial [Clostridia bacterium]|nr:beta-propeller domain-containing protein [Clostridia bacterium]